MMGGIRRLGEHVHFIAAPYGVLRKFEGQSLRVRVPEVLVV